MSLYLKHRPTELEQVQGNEELKESLEKFLSDPETCPHVFLLHGPTGCGKTTIARIIADRLGCKGSDFQEVDSGQFRGIETSRDIRRNSLYKSTEGSCRVWLIDEVHKATNDAQNALLKSLEDTPSHVYFILCTTEPSKIIAAIRGRCQQYEVKPLTERQMKRLLHGIVREEDEELDSEIYAQIFESSQGFPRNAIQILEQVLSVSEEKRMEIARRKAEEGVESIELCRALLKAEKWQKVAEILKRLKEKGVAPEDARRVVIGYCQAILLNGKEDMQAGAVMEQFISPFYDTGFQQLTFACFTVICGNK